MAEAAEPRPLHSPVHAMSVTTKFLPSWIITVGALSAACSSSSALAVDGGEDGSMGCGNVAGCYQVSVTSDPNSPAGCAPVMLSGIFDYSMLASDGNYSDTKASPSWTATLSSCVLTGAYVGTSGTFSYVFTPGAFSGVWVTCINDSGLAANARVKGTRLDSCPVGGSNLYGLDASSGSSGD
jgi:hypothetical protein